MPTTPAQTSAPPGETRHRSVVEFVVMVAFVFATIAFSVDAMLPSLMDIATELVPEDVNRAQLVLSVFMVGMGSGMFFTGPISDAVGRKATITGGIAIYIIGSLLAIFSQSLETLLIARFIQGVGAAGPRIAVIAMVRDLYQGRQMAQIMSFVNMLFILVPAVAPSVGQGIILLVGWRGIFAVYILLGLIAFLWVGLRQHETLPPARRQPLEARRLTLALREAARNRDVVICTLTLALGFGQMFGVLVSAQQLFGETYDKGAAFPAWFAAMALLSAIGTVINIRMVRRVGMHRMASTAYAMQAVFSVLMLVLIGGGMLPDALRFPAFFIWAVSLFMMAGVTFGNLSAIAMQQMGHIAGMVASLVTAVSTILAMLVAAPVGYLYNGTAIPVMTAAMVCSAAAWLLMRFLSPEVVEAMPPTGPPPGTAPAGVKPSEEARGPGAADPQNQGNPAQAAPDGARNSPDRPG